MSKTLQLNAAQVSDIEHDYGRKFDAIEVTHFGHVERVFLLVGVYECAYCGSAAADGRCKLCGAPQNAAAAYRHAREWRR